MARTILVVEDEKSIRDILAFNLVREGYAVETAETGTDGLKKATELSPELVLLDVMLPEMDGFEVLRILRENGADIPIIMLTAREEETDKVLGLDLGADDYITKPFSMRELLARIKANLRRNMREANGSESVRSEMGIVIGELRIDHEAADVYKNGASLALTQREFELIYFLAQSKGKVFTREELMDKVWNYGSYGDARTVDVTVRRLREKVEKNSAEPEYILTKRGLGYMLANI